MAQGSQVHALIGSYPLFIAKSIINTAYPRLNLSFSPISQPTLVLKERYLIACGKLS
jgi:hypothetical protein